jgi:hypothetical protein
MREKTLERLREKGWSKEDIKEAEEVVAKRKREDKSRTGTFMNKVLYWSAIIVIILGNFIISMFLIPFLLVLKKVSLDIIIVTIAFAFGLLFNLLVTDIEHLEKKHHIFALVVVPVIALINFIMMVNISNSIAETINLPITRQNPYFIGVIYVAAFILPYVVTLIRTRGKY